jgi:hypothetical protein
LIILTAFAALASVATGCASRSSKDAASPAPAEATQRPPCRNDVGDDVEVGARTGAEGVKTGATTAVEGVKTFGGATAGLVQGGTDEAKQRWNEGAARTKRTAREGSADTKDEGNIPKCH